MHVLPADLKFLCGYAEVDNQDHEAQSQEKGSKVGPVLAFGQDLVTLGKHPVYVLSVLGSTMYVGKLYVSHPNA